MAMGMNSKSWGHTHITFKRLSSEDKMIKEKWRCRFLKLESVKIAQKSVVVRIKGPSKGIMLSIKIHKTQSSLTGRMGADCK